MVMHPGSFVHSIEEAGPARIIAALMNYTADGGIYHATLLETTAGQGAIWTTGSSTGRILNNVAAWRVAVCRR